MSISIIDYGMGNIKSVSNALEYLGYDSRVVRSPNELKEGKIILPGVGAFGEALENLEIFFPKIRRALESGAPVLGICLGMQAFFRTSDESPETEGFSALKGKVSKVDTEFSLPHIGWNSLDLKQKDCPLFEGLDGGYVYYVHTYHVEPEDPSIITATSDYGTEITGAIWKDNIFGTQFHPEKSGKFGLKILENFLEL